MPRNLYYLQPERCRQSSDKTYLRHLLEVDIANQPLSGLRCFIYKSDADKEN